MDPVQIYVVVKGPIVLSCVSLSWGLVNSYGAGVFSQLNYKRAVVPVSMLLFSKDLI